MRKRDLVRRLERFEGKYAHLVWLARRKKDRNEEDALSLFLRDLIVAEYAAEAAALNGNSRDWNHGFNSGCLATVRLIRGLLGNYYAATSAEKHFPDLHI
jgi:hypothetical protein